MENYILGYNCPYDECTLRKRGTMYCTHNYRDCPVWQEHEDIEELIESINDFNERNSEDTERFI